MGLVQPRISRAAPIPRGALVCSLTRITPLLSLPRFTLLSLCFYSSPRFLSPFRERSSRCLPDLLPSAYSCLWPGRAYVGLFLRPRHWLRPPVDISYVISPGVDEAHASSVCLLLCFEPWTSSSSSCWLLPPRCSMSTRHSVCSRSMGHPLLALAVCTGVGEQSCVCTSPVVPRFTFHPLAMVLRAIS